MKKFLIIACAIVISLVSLKIETGHISLKKPLKPSLDLDIYAPGATPGSLVTTRDKSEKTDAKLITVQANVPGIKPDNITILVENNNLTIKANRAEEKEEKTRNFYRKEIQRGEFETVTSLPIIVDPEKATAELKNGVLTIKLPRSVMEEISTKRVQVPIKEA